ncbi:MAG: glycolate oxidase subunit GlcE [Planctomycetes bacterium]|jgi:glycolate oxidase FAD binding subunit|nr:glycolate oxidase subunit GlcE [Planctomycetota bacterium]
MDSALSHLTDRIRAAAADRTPLAIRAGGSKAFYGNAMDATAVLDPRPYRGIVDYAPTELVVTVRSGTPLAELEAALDARGQMLPFEPPYFGGEYKTKPPHVGGELQTAGDDNAEPTIGGAVAAGLAGPRRASFGPTYGGVRDFVLGASLLDGRGQVLRFGGTVMKNVAGYDVARLLPGSLGVLGVLLDLSIKVLPKPVAEATLRFSMSHEEALHRMNEWAGQPLPVSATMWASELLYVRLSGARAAVDAASARLTAAHGGESIDAEGAAALWRGVRDHRHLFFAPDDLAQRPLWRLSLPSTAEPLQLAGTQLIEWGGALRWLRSEAAPHTIRAQAAALGGHATLFRGGSSDLRSAGVFTPLPAPLAAIHKRLKAEFDPAGIFNRGRMYPEF